MKAAAPAAATPTITLRRDFMLTSSLESAVSPAHLFRCGSNGVSRRIFPESSAIL